MRDALRNQIKSVGNLIKGKDYVEAVGLIVDVKKKIDGCALGYATHADDWIKSCTHQIEPFAIMKEVERMVGEKVKLALP